MCYVLYLGATQFPSDLYVSVQQVPSIVRWIIGIGWYHEIENHRRYGFRCVSSSGTRFCSFQTKVIEPISPDLLTSWVASLNSLPVISILSLCVAHAVLLYFLNWVQHREAVFIERVGMRVANGSHSIPTEDILRRNKTSFEHLYNWFNYFYRKSIAGLVSSSLGKIKSEQPSKIE